MFFFGGGFIIFKYNVNSEKYLDFPTLTKGVTHDHPQISC